MLESDRAFLCAPGMVVVSRVQVPNGEGNSSH
jgi:hypothetical protein